MQQLDMRAFALYVCIVMIAVALTIRIKYAGPISFAAVSLTFLIVTMKGL